MPSSDFRQKKEVSRHVVIAARVSAAVTDFLLIVNLATITMARVAAEHATFNLEGAQKIVTTTLNKR